MELNPIADVEAAPCPCCGVAVTLAWLEMAGRCEVCADEPYRQAPRVCGGRHADELRLFLFHAVDRGLMTGWTAVAAAAIDDAHHAGGLVEDAGRWRITIAAPDPTAWTRIRRMVEVDRTIRTVAEAAVAGAWPTTETARVLRSRLSALSTRDRCGGIWRIEVRPGYQMDIDPPTDFISADTVARRAATTARELDTTGN
jgi:hypothetical protein